MGARLRLAIHHILHPGPPPTRWASMAAVVLGGVGIALLAIIVAGARHGRPARYLGEGEAGTYLSGGLLLLGAVLCAAMVFDRRARSLRRFWTVAAVGFVYLAYDEVAMVHENLDVMLHRAVGWDHRHWLTDRLDDVLVLLYGVAAAWWAVRYRRQLLRLRWTTSTMAPAGLAFALTVVFDLVRGLADRRRELQDHRGGADRGGAAGGAARGPRRGAGLRLTAATARSATRRGTGPRRTRGG